jgi:hypothetical protein
MPFVGEMGLRRGRDDCTRRRRGLPSGRRRASIA